VAAPVVGLVGMSALRKDIKRQTDNTASQLYNGIKAAGRLAAGPVAAATRDALPRVSGALAADVRTSATRTGASVRMGRSSIAYAGYIEFGGNLPRGQSRPYIPTGRYLFPAARGLSAKAAADYSHALSTVLSSSRIWTNTTANGGSVHD
jgi:hypothetical protein